MGDHKKLRWPLGKLLGLSAFWLSSIPAPWGLPQSL